MEDGNRGRLDLKNAKDPGVYFAEVLRNREVEGRYGFDVVLLKSCSFWIGISFHFCLWGSWFFYFGELHYEE
jgi:hypothetical protein